MCVTRRSHKALPSRPDRPLKPNFDAISALKYFQDVPLILGKLAFCIHDHDPRQMTQHISWAGPHPDTPDADPDPHGLRILVLQVYDHGRRDH
jgi:hypothetical protein